jgi:hypothetical protein
MGHADTASARLAWAADLIESAIAQMAGATDALDQAQGAIADAGDSYVSHWGGSVAQAARAMDERRTQLDAAASQLRTEAAHLAG